jgi:hypothetical protein
MCIFMYGARSGQAPATRIARVNATASTGDIASHYTSIPTLLSRSGCWLHYHNRILGLTSRKFHPEPVLGSALR